MKQRDYPLPKISHSKKTITFVYEHMALKKQRLLLNCFTSPYDISYSNILSAAKRDVGIFLKLGYKVVFNHADKTVLLLFNK